MQSKARFLGHPIHPMLIVFPLGLLGASVLFDLLHLATGATEFALVAYWTLAAGLVGGALAAVTNRPRRQSWRAGDRRQVACRVLLHQALVAIAATPFGPAKSV